MFNDAMRANLDQNLAMMGEIIPRLAKQFYDGFLSVGFTELQSLELVKSQLAVMWACTTQGDNSNGGDK